MLPFVGRDELVMALAIRDGAEGGKNLDHATTGPPFIFGGDAKFSCTYFNTLEAALDVQLHKSLPLLAADFAARVHWVASIRVARIGELFSFTVMRVTTRLRERTAGVSEVMEMFLQMRDQA